MEQKLEYEKFMILLTLRSVIPRWKKMLSDAEDNTYIAYFYKQGVDTAKILYGIDIENDNYKEEIDRLILLRWPQILQGLELGLYDYEWTLSSYRYTGKDSKISSDAKALFKVHQLLNTKFNHYGIPTISHETNPIYFELYHLKYNNPLFQELFKELIERGLYNPNKRDIGSSHHPFWSMHNSYNGKSSLDRKVILDSRTNYQMDSNGSSIQNNLAYRIKTYESPEELESCLSLLEPMIVENNCSIIEDYYDDCCHPGYISKMPLIHCLFSDEDKISEIDGLSRIYKYCLSEEGVTRQVEGSTHPSITRDLAIDMYLSLIEKDNPSNVRGKELLKTIKL